MSVNARISVKVNPGISRLPKALRLDGQQRRGALVVVDEASRTEFDRNFKTQGASGGQQWPANSPATQQKKRRQGLGTRVLIATGRLRDALVQRVRGHQADVERVNESRTRFSIGATGEAGTVGDIHARGAGNLPVRNPIQLSPQSKRRIYRRLKTALGKMLPKSLRSELK